MRRLKLISLIIAGVISLSTIFTLTLAATAQSTYTINDLSSDTQVEKQAYQTWKANYVTSNDAFGNLRVQRSAGDHYDTVSEGIGYGMLFAVYNNDKTTFNALWAFEQAHLDANGLMNWQINGGYATGQNAATDADEDMAMALVMADKTWGGYTQAADHQIQLIRQYEVEPGSYVLKPGDVWGGSGEMNPSYLTPGYYQVFASYTGDSSWNQVAAESYNIINSIQQNTAAGLTGFIPDWSTADGYQTNGMSYQYGYDAVRSALRIGLSDSWYSNNVANQELSLLNNSYQKIGFNNIVDGYSLSGQATGTNSDLGGFVAPAAAAAMISDDSNYRASAWTALVNAKAGNDYYSDSLRLFGLLITDGQFVNPLAVSTTSTSTISNQNTNTNSATTTGSTTTTTPTTNDNGSSSSAPAGSSQNLPTPNINIWWPSNDSVVSGTQPFKAMVTNYNIDDYKMYWQVDGGQLNLMSDNNQDYPHKEADVDVSGWNWRGNGPYKITFVVKSNSGDTLGTSSVNITIAN